MPAKKPTPKLNQQIAELEKIVTWLDAQEEVDFESSIEKIETGLLLAKDLKKSLNAIENKFKILNAE